MKCQAKYPIIKAMLKINEITYKQAADMFNVRGKTIWSWINGETDIPAKVVVALADMWGCTTDFLLGRSEI